MELPAVAWEQEGPRWTQPRPAVPPAEAVFQQYWMQAFATKMKYDSKTVGAIPNFVKTFQAELRQWFYVRWNMNKFEWTGYPPKLIPRANGGFAGWGTIQRQKWKLFTNNQYPFFEMEQDQDERYPDIWFLSPLPMMKEVMRIRRLAPRWAAAAVAPDPIVADDGTQIHQGDQPEDVVDESEDDRDMSEGLMYVVDDEDYFSGPDDEFYDAEDAGPVTVLAYATPEHEVLARTAPAAPEPRGRTGRPIMAAPPPSTREYLNRTAALRRLQELIPPEVEAPANFIPQLRGTRFHKRQGRDDSEL